MRQPCDHRRTQCHSSPTHKPLHLISRGLTRLRLSLSIFCHHHHVPSPHPGERQMLAGPRQRSPYRLTPLSARLLPRGVPRGLPHSEPTLRPAPYHPEDILGPFTASYAVSFSHLVLKTLMARPPCQQGTLCISPCDVVKRWRRAPPPKTSARWPWHPTWILQRQISDHQAQSPII